jgi:UDP-N-acetylmuramyl pentapeptide phosphotransferase/UDP-N-acetylglucosamine-1-phosphate transferase
LEKNNTSNIGGVVMLTVQPLVALIISMMVTAITLPLMRKLSNRLDLMGADIHKETRPRIPKLGGLGIFLGVLAGSIAGLYMAGFIDTAVALGLALSASAAIGLLEDFREINPIVKPILIAAAGIPIIILGTYTPYPELPLIGRARLTILYPILILVGITVVANAVNSTDVLNGSMALTSLASLTPLIIISFLEGKWEALMIGLALLGALGVFLSQNYYPARIFSGNAGSLVVGVSIAVLAIVGRLEVVALIALMPQIMNEFHIIFSLGGLRNAKNIPHRPVELEGGALRASASHKAPITLVRLLTATEPLTEREVVVRMALLTSYSALLAIITYLFFIGG